MSKNILYVHPSNELYGSDRSLLRIVSSLDRNEYCPYVAVPNDLSYEGLLTQALQKVDVEYQELNLGVLRRRYRNLKGLVMFGYHTLRAAILMARFCQQKDIRLIHTNSIAVFSGAVAARLAGIPHIWHVREIIAQPKWLNKAVSWMLDKLSNLVVAVSRPVKENLLTVQPQLASKVKVIHNGMNPKPFLDVSQKDVVQVRQTWGVQGDDVVIGMIGRISGWKGQEFLLEGVAKVLKAHPQTQVVLVGGVVPGENWRKEALIQQIKNLGIQENVHIEDFRLDIPTVLAGFDVFVLPSTRPDPFPGVVLEAMFSAKPVVATAHGGALEQVESEVTGLHVSADDPEDLSNCLQYLVEDAELRDYMGRNGRDRALRLFTTNLYVENIIRCYQEVIS